MQTVYLYNLHNPKGVSIRRLCGAMGIPVVEVSSQEYLQPIGALAGLPGFFRTPQRLEGVAFSDEMMLFQDFDDTALSRFHTRYREAGIAKVDLKAGLTPHNIFWNSLQLHDELMEEHRMMNP